MLTRETFVGPWAGLPVAWNEDYSFDEKTYREDVARCCAVGVPGVYTGGTTGEFYAQDFDEFQAITDATLAECKPANIPVMIGCSSTFTLGVIRKARYAREKGADAVQIAVPFWMALQDDEIKRFYGEVADAVPGMIISVYETTRAKRVLPLEVHQWLHQEIPEILMVKSNADTLGHSPEGCAELSKLYNVFVGENSIIDLGPFGAIGSCSSLVYMNPRIIMKMYQHAFRKEWDEVKIISDQCDRIVTDGIATGVAKGCEDSALDRLLGRSCGFLKTSMRCRGPYTSCDEQDLAYLQNWLRTNLPEFLEL